MKYLLDTSVLLCAIWQSHEFHERAGRWLEGKTLAVCALTELGFIRISVNTYGAEMEQARKMLKSFLEKYQPAFLPCDLPVLKTDPSPTAGKTTDFYLASLAAKHGMRLATTDARIAHKAALLIPE